MKIVAFPFTDELITPIGRLVIRATRDHIHELQFTADQVILNPSPLTRECASQLREYFNGERRTFDIPLQQEGTVFQQAVWEKLRQIHYGDTLSYLQLAKEMGDEKVIRAAASANGKNQLCILVPCHRIIGTDGSLTGYAWGLKRKQWLLDHEARTSGKRLSLF